MTIIEIVKQGFHYARTCKSLWIFGFVVGVAGSGGSGGVGNQGNGGGGGFAGVIAAGNAFGLPAQVAAVIVGVVVVAIVAAIAAIVIRYVSEGALIEGIVRARQGTPLTTRQGWRAGVAHWGVLLRIGILYGAATVVSLGLFIVPCMLAVRAAGLPGGLLFGLPALAIAVPWLITLYLVQAFATRIAVLENRRALDAIAKARLFLHGRLLHGMKLIAATFIGTMAVALAGVLAIVPIVLVLVAAVPILGIFPAIGVGLVVLTPVLFVLAAIVGVFQSSIWTIGYVTQVNA